MNCGSEDEIVGVMNGLRLILMKVSYYELQFMAIVDEFDLMAIMPRDLQYDVLFTLVPSYDVQWDIEYICEQPGKETTVYHSPCDLMGVRIKRWENMADIILDRYGWGLSSVQIFIRLIKTYEKGLFAKGDTVSCG